MAGRNPFKGQDVPGSVQSEFNARKDAAKMLRWAAKRVPWIHVMSMSSVCSSKYSPLGNTNGVPALFGSTSATAMYNTTTKLPLPIVTGVEVGQLGNLGTTRKATISIKAYTDEDLVELQKCYFIPGMDIRVQFGWSESCNGTAPTPLYTEEAPRAKAICEIYSRARNNSAYDGFQGVVSNFSYSLTNDNTWDCSIEIIAPADPFAESNISDTQCGCARKTTMTDSEGEEKEVVAKNGQLYAMLLDCFTDAQNARQWASKLKEAGMPATLQNTIGWSSRHYYGKARTETGVDDSSWYEGTWFNDYDTTEQYITFGMLEAAINALTIPNGSGLPYGRVDSSDIILPAPQTIMSTDPRICVIGGGSYELSEKEAGSAGSAIREGGVSLCDIELNAVFLLVQLKGVLEGDKKMTTFLRGVVDEVNRVCGSPWNLEIVSSGDTQGGCSNRGGMEGAAISIVDSKSYEKAGPYLVPSSAQTSAVRNFSLDMKLTGAMKTQALYAGGTQQQGSGNQSGGGDATGCEGTSMEPFYTGGTVTNKAMPSAKRNTKNKCHCDEISSPKKATEPSWSELIEEVKEYTADETCNGLLAKLVEKIHKESKNHCNGVPLPFDFNFECDGIGGFGFGQVVSSDRIPPSIRSNFQWQITKVDHSITANDWITKVGTIARTAG